MIIRDVNAKHCSKANSGGEGWVWNRPPPPPEIEEIECLYYVLFIIIYLCFRRVGWCASMIGLGSITALLCCDSGARKKQEGLEKVRVTIFRRMLRESFAPRWKCALAQSGVGVEGPDYLHLNFQIS
jgi:hypothetical protein